MNAYLFWWFCVFLLTNNACYVSKIKSFEFWLFSLTDALIHICLFETSIRTLPWKQFLLFSRHPFSSDDGPMSTVKHIFFLYYRQHKQNLQSEFQFYLFRGPFMNYVTRISWFFSHPRSCHSWSHLRSQYYNGQFLWQLVNVTVHFVWRLILLEVLEIAHKTLGKAYKLILVQEQE